MPLFQAIFTKQFIVRILAEDETSLDKAMQEALPYIDSDWNGNDETWSCSLLRVVQNKPIKLPVDMVLHEGEILHPDDVPESVISALKT